MGELATLLLSGQFMHADEEPQVSYGTTHRFVFSCVCSFSGELPMMDDGAQ